MLKTRERYLNMTNRNEAEVLYFNTAGTAFTDALPLGNGAVGAMLYGDPLKEKLSLNHEELWTGYPRDGDIRSSAADIEKARALALSGDRLGADRLLKESMERVNAESYQPMGDLFLTFADQRNLIVHLEGEQVGAGKSYGDLLTKSSQRGLASYCAEYLIDALGREHGSHSLYITHK